MSDHLDRLLDGLDLEADFEDITLDRETLRLLAALNRLIRREGAKTVASLDNLTAVIATLDQDVSTAANDVTAAIADLQAQIAALTAGSTITQDQIDALAASVQTADDATNALDASVKPAPTPAP